MSDVYIYESTETDCSTIGLCGALIDADVKFSETGNGDSSIELSHPLDRSGRYRMITEGRIIKASVPVRNAPEIANGVFIDSVEVYEVLPTAQKANRYMRTRKEANKGKKIKIIPVGATIYVSQTYDGEGMLWKVTAKYREFIKKKNQWTGEKTCTGFFHHEPETLGRIETRAVVQSGEGMEAVAPSWTIKEQLFRIDDVKMNERGITATAQHISYDAKYTLSTYNADGEKSLQEACDGLVSECLEDCSLEIYTNLSGRKAGHHFNGIDPITALMDPESGMIARWGGKLIRDNNTLTILDDVGIDRGIRFEYGKNLAGIDYACDMSDVVTAYRPEGTDAKGQRYFLTQSYQLEDDYKTLTAISGDKRGLIFSPIHESYPFERIWPLKGDDCKIDSKGPTEDVVIARLKQQAIDRFNNGADQPRISCDIDIIDLGSTTAGARYADLERVYLWDYATVYYPPLGRELKVRVTEIAEWDCRLDRLVKVSLGSLIDKSVTVPSWMIGGINGEKIEPGTVDTSQLSDTVSTTIAAATEVVDIAMDAQSTANEAHEIATSVHGIAQEAQATASRAMQAVDTSVVEVVTHYLASAKSSGVTTNTPGWTEEPQKKTKKLKYVWIYYTYTFYDGSTMSSRPSINGTEKLDTSNIAVEYYASMSDEELTGGEWSGALPEYETGRYIWTRLAVTLAGATGEVRYLNTRYDADINLAQNVDTVNDAMFDAIDGIGAVWTTLEAPTGASVNDVWMSISDQRVYRAVPGAAGALAWQDITSRGFARSLIEAVNASDMADSKLQTYALKPMMPVSSTGQIDVPVPGDTCMVLTGMAYHCYIYTASGAWQAHDIKGEAQMIALGDGDSQTYTLYVCDGSAWTEANVQLGDIWLNLLDGDTIYRYNGATWIKVGTGYDVFSETLQSVQTIAQEQQDRVADIENKTQYIEVDDAGLHIRAQDANSEMRLTSAAMHISLDGDGGEHYSTFSADYVQFGKYKLRLSGDGGMVFVYDEVIV